MKTELYQCSVIGCNGELQNVYFDTILDAKKYALSNEVKVIKRLAVDMEIVERYEWSSRKIERKVIEVTWDWYQRGEE